MPAKKTAKRKTTPACKLALVIATRKGLWIMKSDAARKSWKLDGPKFLGQIINHAVLDPRDKRTMLVSASTGHLGPTLYRSTDAGRTFKEVKQPPAFAKAPEGDDGKNGRSVGHTFWLTPAHANEPNVGTRAPRRRACSAPGTAATPGRRSPVSTTIRKTASGWALFRMVRPMGQRCIPSSSTRATPSICTSACRAAACTKRTMAVQRGR